ncbi:MAG TPA: hypothetical protein DIC64_02745 [Alphaproteobacteria bacterium]|nr:hypothetical protein [Alphaproteobacteria bacterium]
MPKDLRNIERIAFLEKNKIEFLEIKPLKVDASTRKYFRIVLKNDKTLVLMDDELKRNRLPEFAELSAFLIKHHLHVPEVFIKDFEHGFLLIEDLGDDTFTRLLQKGVDEAFLYQLGTDALIKIAHINERPACCKDLTKERIVNDICFFADWYIPMSKGFPLTETERQEFIDLITPLADLAFKVPNKMVLWDYHVDNIMLPSTAKECAVIDFQDAMWGPLTYDIMSLLEDARRDVRADIQEKMKQAFFNSLSNVSKEDFEDSYAFLSMFRHMRVLGRFTILGYVNGKPQYLEFVPHLWQMLNKTLQYPKFEKIKAWLDKVLPLEKRIIPQRKPITEAILLAAGRGVRMRELTNNKPKPLIKVGSKALIDYNFERVKNAGIKDVVVNLCYQGEMLKEHINSHHPDFNITYSVETEALETGGGIKNALKYFKNEAFFVCNSDVFFEEEAIKPAMWRMIDAWDQNKYDILLLLQDINNICGDKSKGDYRISNDKPERNKQKDEGYPYMFAGIYIIKKSVFKDINESKFSSVMLFDKAQENGRLGYVLNSSTFYHIGTPEALKMAEEKLKS